MAGIAGVARQEWPETLKRLNIDEQWQTDDSQNNYKDAAKPWRRCTYRRKKEEEEETTRMTQMKKKQRING